MSSERILVYKLDVNLASGRTPTELHIVLGDGVPRSRTRPQNLLFIGCPQGIPTFESAFDWAKWYWEIDRYAGYRCEPSDTNDSGRPETPIIDGQVHKGGNPSGPGGGPEVHNPSERVSQSVLQREVQRRYDPLLHRFVGLGSSEGEDDIRREHDNPAPGVLCDGREYETVAPGHVTEYSGRGRILATILDSQGRLQASTNSGPSTAHDRSSEIRTGDSPREGDV